MASTIQGLSKAVADISSRLDKHVKEVQETSTTLRKQVQVVQELLGGSPRRIDVELRSALTSVEKDLKKVMGTLTNASKKAREYRQDL